MEFGLSTSRGYSVAMRNLFSPASKRVWSADVTLKLNWRVYHEDRAWGCAVLDFSHLFTPHWQKWLARECKPLPCLHFC